MADEAQITFAYELQRRDATAWARAYDQCASDVYSFIAHLMHRNQASAEEIHQETWLAALRGIDGYDVHRGEFRAWVFGIARYQVALHLRRRLRSNSTETLRTEIADGSLLPLDVLGSIERGDAVRAALAELGEESRRAVLGKYIGGHSVHDLAGQLGRSPKAIESLLSRARAQLRSLLSGYFEDSAKDVNHDSA